MKKFWESKKWLSLAVCVIMVIGCAIANTMEGISIDANIILAVIGLNTIYILRQGSIDSKKTDQNVFKNFWESNKFMALIVGDILPLFVAFLNSKYSLEIPVEAIAGLVGLDAVYILRQGAIDSKTPKKH